MVEIYDENVIRLLDVSPDICSIAEAEAIHEKLIDHNYEKLKCTHMPHYRGEQNFGWDITANIFRGAGVLLTSSEGKINEAGAASEFVQKITETYGKGALRKLFEGKNYGSQWNALFQAQHGGIRTTLLDWSARIDRAIYFATEKNKNGCFEKVDGQLWVYLISKQNIIGDSFNDLDPSNLEKSTMLNITIDGDDIDNRLWEKKMNNQFGAFFISTPDKCNIPLNQQPEIKANLFRFRIPAKYKLTIREELDRRHLNEKTMHIRENDPQVQKIIDLINVDVIKKH